MDDGVHFSGVHQAWRASSRGGWLGEACQPDRQTQKEDRSPLGPTEVVRVRRLVEPLDDDLCSAMASPLYVK